MDTNAAHLLTFTTYGTWLHGDPRGSHDARGAHTEVLAPSPKLAARMAARMDQPPMYLNEECREIVDAVVFEFCRFRRYSPLAVNVRSAHVHALVAGIEGDPDVLTDRLKSWCTRRLREAGLVGPERKVWTRGHDVRRVIGAQRVAAAERYVNERQGVAMVERLRKFEVDGGGGSGVGGEGRRAATTNSTATLPPGRV